MWACKEHGNMGHGARQSMSMPGQSTEHTHAKAEHTHAKAEQTHAKAEHFGLQGEKRPRRTQ